MRRRNAPIHGVTTPSTSRSEAPQVKKPNEGIRASHVNAGTSRRRARSWVSSSRQLRHPRLRVEVESTESTAYGGLGLAAALIARLRVPQAIDERLSLLQSHRPFHESDHVLTHVYNLYVGGSAIEDIADLQQSEPVHRILGTSRIPDPTTAGDFLRRFDAASLSDLDHAIDEIHIRAWKRAYGKRRRKRGVVDLDSHVRHVYGNQKEGADFTYKGGFGYHPLVISLAGTQECLRLVNRPGNVTSAEGAAGHLRELINLLKSRFETVLVRGDSAFARQDIFDACDEHGLHFAMVSPAHTNFEGLADSLEESCWKPFQANTARSSGQSRRRKRGVNRRRRTARRRGKRDLKLERQWIGELDYQPARSEETYRLIVRRQRVEESNQGELFELWRYRYVITNLPKSISARTSDTRDVSPMRPGERDRATSGRDRGDANADRRPTREPRFPGVCSARTQPQGMACDAGPAHGSNALGVEAIPQSLRLHRGSSRPNCEGPRATPCAIPSIRSSPAARNHPASDMTRPVHEVVSWRSYVRCQPGQLDHAAQLPPRPQNGSGSVGNCSYTNDSTGHQRPSAPNQAVRHWILARLLAERLFQD